MGLDLNLQKCELWGPGVSIVDALQPPLTPAEGIITRVRRLPFGPRHPGVEVLGLPIDYPGSDVQTDATWTSVVNKLQVALHALEELNDPQIGHTLLRSCLDACKVMHLLKSSSALAPCLPRHLAATDSLIMAVFEDCIGHSLPPMASLQATLPIRYGGCGIRLPSHYHVPARLAFLAGFPNNCARLSPPGAWTTPSQGEVNTIVNRASTFLGSHFEPLVSWKNKPTSIHTGDPKYHQQSWWSDRFCCQRSIELSGLAAQNPRDGVRLLYQNKGFGAGWMKSRPSVALQSIITPDEYRIGFRWRLSVPLLPDIPDISPCPRCSAAVCDRFGDHLMCCKHNNFTARHGAVQDCLLEFLTQANLPVEREQPLTKANSRLVLQEALRPADLLLKRWANGKDVAIDVTVCHPLQKCELPWSINKGTSFLKRREDAKIAKYFDACALEGWDFLPIAFSTWGSTGPQAYTLLRRILRRAAMGTDADSRSARISEMSNRLSLSLFRQLISLLHPIHLL